MTTGCSAKQSQPPQPAATRPETLPEADTTKTYGTIPDMRGTWFMVTHVIVEKETGKRVSNFSALYRIDSTAEQFLAQRFTFKLPDELEQDRRNADAQSREWKPTPVDLAALAHRLRTDPGKIVKAGFRFIGRDSYSDSDKQSPEGSGSLFAFEASDPGPGTLGAAAAYYAWTKEPDLVTGRFSSGALSIAAGVPVPIGFSGTFDMYRLPE
ncbi:MAG: hypothetical protein HY699_13300 [Deltaproteobacteria bacterium]|nr:hypothetical protein [Deltaproteobacteria bacterium]